MPEIIPRWEWRAFGKRIETQLDLGDCPRTRHVESSEIYLASATSEDNPKIRDEQIDIKRLQQVNHDGLQQWKPVLKASFPLSADQLAEVLGILGVEAPPETGVCDLGGLLRLIDKDPRTWAVFVDKVRDLYDVDGCTVEASDVSFDGETLRTVAAEDPDPVKVRETVARLGLLQRENLSYIQAIQLIKAGRLA